LRQTADLEGYRIERTPEGPDKYDLVDLHSGEPPQRWPLTVDELEVFLEID
jgi:hypothetical protein